MHIAAIGEDKVELIHYVERRKKGTELPSKIYALSGIAEE